MWLALKVIAADVHGPEGLLSVGGLLNFVHEDRVNLLVPVNVRAGAAALQARLLCPALLLLLLLVLLVLVLLVTHVVLLLLLTSIARMLIPVAGEVII